MTIETVLAQCESLPHGERIRLMIELGRQSRSDSEIATTLEALTHGDVYQRKLALYACYGSGNSSHALIAFK